MKHPLTITLIDVNSTPAPMRPYVLNVMGFRHPKRVPVALAGAHPDPKQPGEAAAGYYWRNGRAARRVRVADGKVVYRLPWRYWRYRHRDASGDWRLTEPGQPLELVGILLLAPGTIPERVKL